MPEHLPQTRTFCHHDAVSYFTAVLARSDAGWRAVAVDVEDAESLDELAEALRAASRGGPVLAVLEREDAWFAMVRVDGDDDDARSFVSDLAATERSQYAELLAPVGDVDMSEHAHLRVPRQQDFIESDDLDFAADDDEIVGDVDGDGADLAAAGPTSGNGVDGEPARGEPVHVRQPVAVATAEPPPWAGDPGLLADVGVTADELVALVDEGEGDPASVIAAVGERCGFDELLDALR